MPNRFGGREYGVHALTRTACERGEDGARVQAAQHPGCVQTGEVAREPTDEIPVPDDGDKGVRPVLEIEDRDVRQRLAMPRVPSMAAGSLVHQRGGPPPSNDLQVALVRAGLERRDINAALVDHQGD